MYKRKVLPGGLVTIEQIAKVCSISEVTVRTITGGWRFEKFRAKGKIFYNIPAFWEELKKVLEKKKARWGRKTVNNENIT